MAVPRKRKKIANQTAQPSSSGPAPAGRPQGSRPSGTSTRSFARLDSAFDIVESLDQTLVAREQPAAKPAAAQERSGLSIRFAFEAVMPGEAAPAPESSRRHGKVPLVDIHFTVPFIWELPVIGPAARKAVYALRAPRITGMLDAVKPAWLKKVF